MTKITCFKPIKRKSSYYVVIGKPQKIWRLDKLGGWRPNKTNPNRVGLVFLQILQHALSLFVIPEVRKTRVRKWEKLEALSTLVERKQPAEASGRACKC